MKTSTVIWTIIILIIGGIYLLTRPDQRSNSEKYSECTANAGKIYDSSRETITTNSNGYNRTEQEHYYRQTNNGYAHDLETCRQLYGQ